MSSLAVLRQADRYHLGQATPWDLDPVLLESLRAITDHAAAAGTGARLVMAARGGAPQTLTSARCGRQSWRAVADRVLEDGETVQTDEVLAALVEGARGLRGVLVLYGDDFDGRARHVARAYAARIEEALLAAEARRTSGQHMAEALLKTLAAYDDETARHSQAVQRLALALGREYGLSPHDLLVLEWAALLHDLGKIGMPQALLTKQKPLSQAEWAVVRQHPTCGEHMVQSIPLLGECAPVIRHHHERWDGTGYPDRLSRAATPLAARIIGLVDAYETMRTGRRYRPARTREEALAELAACSGTQFDPGLVQTFAEIPHHVLGL